MMMGVCVASRCRITFVKSQNAKNPDRMPIKMAHKQCRPGGKSQGRSLPPKWHCFLVYVVAT